MPVRSLHSPTLWTSVEHLLKEEDEHVCVLPMTTLIKPVRVITLVQIDTTATAAMSPCPPGSVNLPPDTPGPVTPGPVTPEPVTPGPTPPPTVPLYRLYHNPGHDHLYTTSAAERDQAAATGWGYEVIQCNVLSTQVTGSVPVYRSYEVNNLDHFLTTDQAEWRRSIDVSKYTEEGIAFYVHTTQQPGTIPLYRLNNPSLTDHLYTTNEAERQSCIASSGFLDEGILGYVYPA